MSGRKNALLKFQSITNGDMSQPSITSAVSSIEFLDDIGIQFVFTGTPTGTFFVQVSADYAQDSLGNVTNAGNWIDIPFSETPIAAGSASSVYCDIQQMSAPWIRATYNRTSGSGTLNAFLTAKMI